MDTEAIVSLIANLWRQLANANARIAELEAEPAEQAEQSEG